MRQSSRKNRPLPASVFTEETYMYLCAVSQQFGSYHCHMGADNSALKTRNSKPRLLTAARFSNPNFHHLFVAFHFIGLSEMMIHLSFYMYGRFPDLIPLCKAWYR